MESGKAIKRGYWNFSVVSEVAGGEVIDASPSSYLSILVPNVAADSG